MGYQHLNQSSAGAVLNIMEQTTNSSFLPSPDQRFGKRVFVDNKMNSKEVLEIHLQQMKEKNDNKRYQKDYKLQEDRQFL